MTQDKDYAAIRGCSAEMLVALKFAEQGYIASFPLRTCGYDLVVDDGVEVRRVQVKQAYFQKARKKPGGGGDRACWLVALDYKGKTREGTKRRRRPGSEFNVLAVVCRPDLIYVIPSAVLVNGRQDGMLPGRLQIKEPMNGGRKDAVEAGERWMPFCNNFALTPAPPPVAKPAERQASPRDVPTDPRRGCRRCGHPLASHQPNCGIMGCVCPKFMPMIGQMMPVATAEEF